MTEIATEERSWTCACTSEHRPTISRAWCFDCSEWCYPTALCVRGEAEQLREQVKYAQGGQYVAVMRENEQLQAALRTLWSHYHDVRNHHSVLDRCEDEACVAARDALAAAS